MCDTRTQNSSETFRYSIYVLNCDNVMNVYCWYNIPWCWRRVTHLVCIIIILFISELMIAEIYFAKLFKSKLKGRYMCACVCKYLPRVVTRQRIGWELDLPHLLIASLISQPLTIVMHPHSYCSGRTINVLVIRHRTTSKWYEKIS